MQPLSSRKVTRPTLISSKVKLAIGSTVMALMLVTFFSPVAQTKSGPTVVTVPTTCPAELLHNGGFELPGETLAGAPLNWGTSQSVPSSQLIRDESNAHSGASSVRITAPTANDAWFWQEVSVEPQTVYLLTGWIKTENVSSGAGANLSLVGTWSHTEGLFGTKPWTRVSLFINSGFSSQITIGARLGYSAGTSVGTAWFDDLQLTMVKTDGFQPRWKILVLIYDRTDVVMTDRSGVQHHMLGNMTPAEVQRATVEATQFVQTDIPALTSGNMIPELTIRYSDHPLKPLNQVPQSWSPSPDDTASDVDPTFDSVIVIWDPRVVDEDTGMQSWIGAAAGLATPRGRGQTYTAIIIEATGYGHRNVFKHEWGHCILFYFDAMGTAPKPAVTNHAEINQYVHWPNGDSYVWVDESDANPISNSIYNNASGFTHDYYSGTTATADQPTRRLGITPEAWTLGGPVTKPGAVLPPPVFICGGDITLLSDPGTCWTKVSVAPPTAPDGCDIASTLIATRSDGLPIDAPYSCGRTVITWSVPNGTATCEQVVTVNDVEPPHFLHFPPPVTVNTGPDATSCGAVVDDIRLGSTVPAANPEFVDEVRNPPSARSNDIASTAATTDGNALTFTVTLTQPVFPASSNNPRGLTGYIDIDIDWNPATGVPSSIIMFPLKLNMGVEFEIDLGSEAVHPGFVDVILKERGPVVVGKVPIVINGMSFSIAVPLTLLGNDNGLMQYAVSVGVVGIGQTDNAPNGAIPIFSHALPGLLARDDCAGLTISRTGVPANNLFPIGETLITYTASDASGNTAFWTQKVTVVDDTPPVISGVAVNPSTLWPPNHEMVDVTVSYDAADNCAVGETWLSVSSNSPATDGTEANWEVIDAHHVLLRAERSRGSERLYTISITATDAHGNLSSHQVTVRVPAGNGKGGPKISKVTTQRPRSPAPDGRLYRY